MISISAVIVLAIFVVLFMVLVVMMGAHVYHGYRFGRNEKMTMGVNTAFLVAVASIVVFTILLLAPVDWSQSFSIDVPNISTNARLPEIDLPDAPSDLPSLFE